VEEFSELEEGEDLEEGNGGASEEEFDVPEASTSGSHHEGPFIDIDETVWCCSSMCCHPVRVCQINAY